ncbi:MFS transporter [Pseudomonas sp. Choline-3u-10]|jgi:MFS family permease|uniref:MFS transporter n=1 Tax=Pseudomonadaceae TaxID=135621 RepID=UPI000617E59D|nr:MULTISPECIES: MFS transporter [Pseudomonadaceae]MAL37987.1 MFS transporter [Pseudomonas sp.]MBU0947201.1 MFS transporter [Gammaproteobacteria bacterium]KJJ62640.1 MFS transporter [Pseudomonas sp. 10B238]MBK3793455.1 MFS transporter [Stutzerimonas stutzeri]MBK3874945.1 MFS transporter [Stutzerimonas stutzeri]|tara:strand:+ start:2136 stop:3317 length:1182 start_codon:yes stop_codon:yes gene_type:complete
MLLLFSNSQVLRLFIAQALFWSCSMTGIILTSIVGLHLAPVADLATLPLALLMLGGLLALQPIAWLMQRRGRTLGFLVGTLAGVLGGLTSALSLWLDSFTLLCLGALPIGAYQASAMYYRFAAMEAVSEALRGRATGCVIGGGVVAALAAPALGDAARGLVSVPFAGAYLMIAALAAVGFFVLAGLKSSQASAPVPAASSAVSWRDLIARPVVRAAVLTTAAGHGLMILVMNATPLAMHGEGMNLQFSGQVIQWHMLGMFLPAFIAGPLVDRLGSRMVACLGGGLLIASALVALLGVSHLHFLISSCLLGIGWNLMLVAGTTQLGQGHGPQERARAQGLMELCNGSVAAVMSFASGALIAQAGWAAVNIGMLPIVALVLLVQLAEAYRQRQPA